MKWTRRAGSRMVLGVAIVALAAASSACFNPLTILSWFYPADFEPITGPTHLNVTYFSQQSDLWCGEATVAMWADYVGQPVAQSAVLAWMTTNYNNEVGLGGSLQDVGIAHAATHFVGGTPIVRTFYIEDEYRRAMGDQLMNLQRGQPTIVIGGYGGRHALILVGASWSQLSTMQPALDFMTYHDPEWPEGGPNLSVTVWEWMYTVGNAGGFMSNIQRGDTYQSSDAAVAEFDAWGGTYYSEPDPPPECDKCPPPLEDGHLESAWSGLKHNLGMLASLFQRPSPYAKRQNAIVRAPRVKVGSAKSDHGVRKEIYVPKPYATSSRDILQNLWTGLQQTKMYKQPGWEKLGSPSQLVATRIEPVISLSDHPDYYLITLATLDGRPYALTAVSSEGWLLAATVLTQAPAELEQTGDWAAARIGSVLSIASSGARRVYADGNVQSPAIFRPLWQVDTPSGPVFVDHRGQVLAETETGQAQYVIDGRQHPRYLKRVGK